MSSDYVTTKNILVLESPMSFSHMDTGIYEICGTNLSSMKIFFLDLYRLYALRFKAAFCYLL